MRINFSSSFLTDLERIDNVLMIDRVKIGDSNYKPEVVYHKGVVQACIIGVVEEESGTLEFYYNGKLNVSEGTLAFTITSDSPIKLNNYRTIFEFNISNLSRREVKAEIGCPWLTADTKFLEGISTDLGYSFYKDIEISPDSLIWKESIGKYVTDRGLTDNHIYDVERLDTKKGVLEERPIRFKSYRNIIIDQGNWKVDSTIRTIITKHDVYSEISSSMFYVWDSPMIDASINYETAPTCIERFGEYLDPENVVFGNTDCFQYINFQGDTLRGFRITGTEGSKVEARFNRLSTLGTYTSFSCSIDSSGVAELRIPSDLPYAHLNGIVTVGPSKIEKIETIQYLEEPVDVEEPNPDKTYVVEINNVNPSCTVIIGGTCDYIEYEKYLGKVTEVGRGTEHINSIPEIEIVSVGENHGLDYKIDNKNRQIECFYNSSTVEKTYSNIFQVKIENNILVSGNTIYTNDLNSDYKIKIDQTGIIWKITNSPDYTYTDDEGKSYGIFLVDYEKDSKRTLEIITNRLDYGDLLNVDNTSAAAFHDILSFSPEHLGIDVIDGEKWNVYNFTITASSQNNDGTWRPQINPGNYPCILNLVYNNQKVDSLSFCPIQLSKDPKIKIWEETLPGKFTMVKDGVLRVFNSMTKNFIVVRSSEPGETKGPNWYYYDLNGINKFYLTDSNSLINNVGVIFLNSDQTASILEPSDRDIYGRTLNVNRSDLINSLGVLTVTESPAYPKSWRDLIDNNTVNVEVIRELSNIFIQVGPYPVKEGEEELRNEDYTLKVNKVGIYTIKVRSNFKYVIETSSEGYIRFVDFTEVEEKTRTEYSTRKEVFSLYNEVTEFTLALTKLDDEGGLEKSGIEIRSGNLVRMVYIEVDNLEVKHDYKTKTDITDFETEEQSYLYKVENTEVDIEKPNIIRIFENGTEAPDDNIFLFDSTTTPQVKLDGSILSKEKDKTIPVFYGRKDESGKEVGYFEYYRSTVPIIIPKSLSFSKYPMESFGSIIFKSLSYSDSEEGSVEYPCFIKGKEHYLWCVDNISDLSSLEDPDLENYNSNKNVFLDASGESGRNVYVVSRYSVSNNTFITEYPEESEIKIKRNDLEAIIKISSQQKIGLDTQTQIEYAIPINISCNVENNGGLVFLGGLDYIAKTVIVDGSIKDVITVSNEIEEKEDIDAKYITDYITGKDGKPEQTMNLRLFQNGNDKNVYKIFSDITDFGIMADTKYIIPEVGSEVKITNVSYTVTSDPDPDPNPSGSYTITEEYNDKYFLFKVECEDRIKENKNHWFESIDDNILNTIIKNTKYTINIATTTATGESNFSSTFTRYGCNYGFYIKGVNASPSPGPSKNPVISIDVNIINNTGQTVTLDGDLYFVLGNPDHNGNYMGWTGIYNKTGHIYFSSSAVSFGVGETKSFGGLTWNDEGNGLGEKSPIDPALLSSTDYHHNVAVYVGGNGEVVYCENLSPNIVFTEGGVYDIVLASVGSGTNPGTDPGPSPDPDPGTADGNPVISFGVNIINNTGQTVSLDGRLRFMLGNPNQDGSWFAGWSGGPYIRTDNIWFSGSAVTMAPGETRTFSGLTWQDADSGCGLGGASPLSSSYLPVYADDGSIAYAGNVLMYTDNRSDVTLCQNLSSSIIFTQGGVYDIILNSTSSRSINLTRKSGSEIVRSEKNENSSYDDVPIGVGSRSTGDSTDFTGKFGFGTVKSEENEKGICSYDIPAAGGRCLMHAGVFYAVDGLWNTEALRVPFKYEFIGTNIPEEVTWEDGNVDDYGNLCIKIPPRLRDDPGYKDYIMHVVQPHEYYPIDLYVRLRQESFVTDPFVPDTSKKNYKLKFDRDVLNVYSDGTVEGGDKIYFTHNLNEEAFKRVSFSWETPSALPKEPDDLSYLEISELNYEESYVRFKFKPNGSSKYITTNIAVYYGNVSSIGSGTKIGTLKVVMGYYSLVLSYRTGDEYIITRVTNYISRLSPKSLCLYKMGSTQYYYSEFAPCWTQNDNANASGGKDNGNFTASRNVFMISAYRKEFYDTYERVYGISKKAGSTDIQNLNSSNNGKFPLIFKEAELLNSSPQDNFEYVDLSFNPISSGIQDTDAKVNPLYDSRSTSLVPQYLKSSTNFSSYSPYLEVAYKCKEEYIPWDLFLTTQNKVVLLDEDTGGLVNFYFSISEYKCGSDEIMGPIEFSDLNLHFDCNGGTKQVSFRPATYKSYIKVSLLPNSSWISYTVMDNAISFKAEKNTSEIKDTVEESKYAYYRTAQARIDVKYSTYILQTLYINLEQEPDIQQTSGSGEGGGSGGGKIPSNIYVKVKIKNSTGKQVPITGEIKMYVGGHNGIFIDLPGASSTSTLKTLNIGEETSEYSVNCVGNGVKPDDYLDQTIESAVVVFAPDDGYHNSTMIGATISGNSMVFSNNASYVITLNSYDPSPSGGGDVKINLVLQNNQADPIQFCGLIKFGVSNGSGGSVNITSNLPDYSTTSNVYSIPLYGSIGPIEVTCEGEDIQNYLGNPITGDCSVESFSGGFRYDSFLRPYSISSASGNDIFERDATYGIVFSPKNRELSRSEDDEEYVEPMPDEEEEKNTR